MTLSRRSLFKLATVTAAGLALPATDILADAEELARRYWALDQTHLTPGTTPATHAARVAAWGEDVSPAQWWNVAHVVGANRYHTTIKTDAPMASLRVGTRSRSVTGPTVPRTFPAWSARRCTSATSTTPTAS